MEFRTKINLAKADFEIGACEQVLLVGSCFANGIGQHFKDNGFTTTVNPYGTMYNPVSVLHTLERLDTAGAKWKTVFLTLGTNHVYRLKETGEIVDNCEKRPAVLFQEEELTIDECTEYLQKAVSLLLSRNAETQIVLTVSPIRYKKYGYHQSQLSKAILLLAIEQLMHQTPHGSHLHYFPSYEIFMDELRDYRFYATDMLHPSEQAVDYIWERLTEWCFSADAKKFIEEWKPLHQALAHRPLHPESEEYRRFAEQTQARLETFKKKYPSFQMKD